MLGELCGWSVRGEGSPPVGPPTELRGRGRRRSLPRGALVGAGWNPTIGSVAKHASGPRDRGDHLVAVALAWVQAP